MRGSGMEDEGKRGEEWDSRDNRERRSRWAPLEDDETERKGRRGGGCGNSLLCREQLGNSTTLGTGT